MPADIVMNGVDVVNFYIGDGINPTLQKLQQNISRRKKHEKKADDKDKDQQKKENQGKAHNAKDKGKAKEVQNTEEETSAIWRHSPDIEDIPQPHNIQLYQPSQVQGEAGPSGKRPRASESLSLEAPTPKRTKSNAEPIQKNIYRFPTFKKIQPKSTPKVLVPDSDEAAMSTSQDVPMHRATPSPPPGSPNSA